MKVTSPNWNFIFLVNKGDIAGAISNYFTYRTQIDVTRYCNGTKEYSSLSIFRKYFERIKVLQLNIEDVLMEEGILSYSMFLITKNKFGQIDFTEHRIVNKWEGDKISGHSHTITPH